MALVHFSFDRPGFRAHQKRFVDGDLDVDMTGRVCLVTGANSGIGFETSMALARRGATLLMLCRSAERGQRAADQIAFDTGNRNVVLEIVDVSSRRSVREFCDRLSHDRVDVLVNNAGVLPSERTLTDDGFELTLATNLLGPVWLTEALLPRLRAAGDRGDRAARVVYVSSGGMYTQKLNLEKLEGQTGSFDGTVAYAQTKRAMTILTEQWAEREPGVRFFSMHPGWADTVAVRESLPRFYRVLKKRLRTAEEAADTVVWLSVADAVDQSSGTFWFDRAQARTHLVPWTRENDQARTDLWHAVHAWADGGAG